MKRRSLPFLSLIAAALVVFVWPEVAACGQKAAAPGEGEAASGQRVVLTIGEEKITASDIDKFIQTLPPQYRAFYGGPGKYLLPQYIVAMKVLSAEALRLNLQAQPEVARSLEIARESVLSEAARKHFQLSIVVSEQELKDLYQKDKTLSDEVRIGHILIQTQDAPMKSETGGKSALPEPEARAKLEDIRKRILAGADFAQMAKQYSEDPATAASGGDMGVLQREKVVPAIVHAADALAPGQVSEILQTPFGLEIIKVEEKRTKSFNEVRPALEAQLRQSKASEIVQHMMDKYHTVIDQQFFAGPSATPSTSSAPAH